jgi:hypothetical protein
MRAANLGYTPEKPVRSSVARNSTRVPFQRLAKNTRFGLPTRLADGLGFESTLVQGFLFFEPAPREADECRRLLAWQNVRFQLVPPLQRLATPH